jgi:hypothetical protein
LPCSNRICQKNEDIANSLGHCHVQIEFAKKMKILQTLLSIMPYHVILGFAKQSENIALPLPLSFEIIKKMNILHLQTTP